MFFVLFTSLCIQRKGFYLYRQSLCAQTTCLSLNIKDHLSLLLLTFMLLGLVFFSIETDWYDNGLTLETHSVLCTEIFKRTLNLSNSLGMTMILFRLAKMSQWIYCIAFKNIISMLLKFLHIARTGRSIEGSFTLIPFIFLSVAFTFISFPFHSVFLSFSFSHSIDSSPGQDIWFLCSSVFDRKQKKSLPDHIICRIHWALWTRLFGICIYYGTRW